MRKIMLLLHRWLGIVFGVFISIICLTGAMIVFQDEIKTVINTRFHNLSISSDAVALPPDSLAVLVQTQADSLTLVELQMPYRLTDAAVAQFAETGRKKLFVSAVTGEVLGWEREAKLLTFAKNAHRYLLNVPSEPHEGMSVGRFIVGTTAIVFTLILLTGLFLWFPLNKKMLRNRLTVATGKGWHRFLYDSHVVLGFYALVFLLLMSLTGPSWSFHWYRAGAMKVLGGDVSLMEHHGQFEQEQQERTEVRFTQAHDPNEKVVHNEHGLQAQRILFTLHTGTWGGLITKILYFLAALIGACLPWTGYYLWWKRTHKATK